MTPSANVLALYDAARAALAKAVTVDEAKKVRDVAARIKFYAQQAQDTEIVANAAVLKLRATRRLGELLAAAKEAGEVSQGGRPKKTGPAPGPVSPIKVTLKAVGLPKNLSADAQKLAKLDDNTFAKLIDETREKYLATAARVVNPQSDVLVRQRKVERRAEVVKLSKNPLLLPKGPFCGGVADPPWVDNENPIGFNNRHYLFKYPTMTVEQICALPVKHIFGDRAAILLWCTRYHVAIGSHVKVLEAWGFRPRTEYCWDKELRGTGKGFSVDRHECLILGLRGDVPAPDDENRPLSLFSQRRSRLHSQKPDWAHRQIEIWLPGGSYVDLFPGAKRDGWCPWGHQALGDAKRHEQGGVPG